MKSVNLKISPSFRYHAVVLVYAAVFLTKKMGDYISLPKFWSIKFSIPCVLLSVESTTIENLITSKYRSIYNKQQF